MKKFILTLALIVSTAVSYAQVDDLYCKVEGGFNLGSLRSDAFDSKYNGGWQARVFGQLYMNDQVGLEAGLGVTDIRSKLNLIVMEIDGKGYILNGGGLYNKWDVTYLDIPIRSVARSYDLGVMTFQPAVGVYLGIGLRARDEEGHNLFKDKILQRFNFGIEGKLDVVFVDYIKIGVGYQRGFVNMSRDKSKKMRPSSIIFSVGVIF